MTEASNLRLFVYGTLLHATGRADVDTALREQTLDRGPATLEGRLYHVGGYPGAVSVPGSEIRVHGRLFEVRDGAALWPVLDAYEDFDRRNPASAEFAPVPVEVSWQGQRITAVTYLYQRPVRGLEPIPSGDWLAWRAERDEKPAHGVDTAQAEGLIHRRMQGFGTLSLPWRAAIGHVLAEDLRTDRDLPPYDRVAMDGIAVSGRAWDSGQRRFRIAGSQYAGAPREALADSGACLKVMTGAILPEGCDRVIRIEEVIEAEGIAEVSSESEAAPFKNVHRRGSDRKAGDQVLTRGQGLRAPEIGIAASIGCVELSVYRRPIVTLITTGDELVPIEAEPLEHQVRQSNGPALVAALAQQGIEATWRHVSDDEAALRTALASALQACDVLLVTGGVSMGERDLVPAALQAVGVREIFHKVKQRPGKPLWFGVTTDAAARPVFALPGNPVSVLVCMRRYVMPALRRAMGFAPEEAVPARLARPLKRGPKGFAVFAPCRLEKSPDGSWLAHPVANQGSGDFAALEGTSGFIALTSEGEDGASASGDALPAGTHFPAGALGRFFGWTLG